MGQSDTDDSLPTWRATLRKSGNPYSAHYYEPDTAVLPAEEARRRFRASENPYALHYYLGADEDAEAATRSSAAIAANPAARGRKTLSKADFDSGCRSIFRRYMPEMERARLRPHHQDFIRRNVNCSPERRYALLEELRRYDLSAEGSLRTYFNREEDDFTEAKLLKIEGAVGKE